MSASIPSRRNFLRAAGLGAAAVWLPKPVKGYSAAEMRALAANGDLARGISKWDLDTPALCLDLDKLERNIETARATTVRNGIAPRPHGKTHKCPAIGRLQIAGGAVGICAAKVSEAEAFLEHGIERVMMTTSNVTPFKIRRAMALRQWYPGFIQCTDNPQNARDLSDAAREAGIVADVIIDVDPGMHRTGMPPGQPALELAQLVEKLPGLRLRGMMAYDGGSQHVQGFKARRLQTLEKMAGPAETCALMQRAGLNTEIFSGGGTGTYNIDHEIAGFTDVQCGSYAFLDSQYLAIGSADGNETIYTDFAPSLTVVATVLNTNFEGRATADAGAKALTINEPDPIVVGETGIAYRSRADEFGSIRYENPSRTYRVGDKLELIIPHCDPVVNLWDQVYGTRNDKVEVIWPIYGRGRSQ